MFSSLVHRKYKFVSISLFILMLMSMVMPGAGSVMANNGSDKGQDPSVQAVTIDAPAQLDLANLPVAPEGSSSLAPGQKQPAFNLPQNVKNFAAQKEQATTQAMKPGANSNGNGENLVADVAGDAASDPGAEVSGPSAAALGDSGSGPAPLDPSSNTNFPGRSENGLIPPDTNVAAGTRHLVEVVNDEIVVYGKGGVTLKGPFTLAAWFGRASTDFIFDPTVIYRGGRFYVVTLFLNTSTKVSQILLSASRSDDATGAWCNYTLQGSQTAGVTWADFPRIGATSNRLLIATNQFRFDNNAFQQNFLLELPKSSIDACAGFSYSTWFNFTNANGSVGFTLNPALDYDAFGGTAFYIANGIFGSSNQVTIWRRNVSGATWTRYSITTQNYAIPPDARQPGTSTRIATNDDRLLTAVKRYNKLWLTQTSAFNPSCGFNISAVHYIAINAPASTVTAPSLNHDLYYFADCNLDYYYPAATVDGNGNMLSVFNRSSTGEYANLRFTGWHAANFQNQTVLIGGGGYFGSTRLGGAPGAFTETRGRWGDYSGIGLDPVNPQQFVWVAGEILNANNFWGTRIGRIWHAPVPSNP